MKNFDYYVNEHAIILFFSTLICIAISSIFLKFDINSIYNSKQQTANSKQQTANSKQQTANSKQQQIDGLRGLLALFVLSYHFYLTYIWKSSGIWEIQPTPVITNHGSVPVSLFFLITGFLFLNKIRQPAIDWKKLYISRFKRICPLYFLMIIPVIVFTAIYFIEHHQDWRVFFKWLEKWLVFRGEGVGGFQSWIVIAGVQWTLLYEWAFYFSLPLFWLLWHRKRLRPILIILVPLLSFYILGKSDWYYYQLFAFALPAVWAINQKLTIFEQRKIVVDLFILSLLVMILWITEPYSYLQMIGLSIVFLFISRGYNFFGMLCQRGLCILGTISYSIYLVHGFVLYLLFTVIGIYDFSKPNFYYFMMYLPVVFAIVIGLSLLTYRFVERPFLHVK